MSEGGLEERLAHHWRERRIAENPRDPRHLLPPIPPTARRVLDVGCGAGQTLLGCRLGPGILPSGIDGDVEALVLGCTWSPNIRFVAALGEALPFRTAVFDVVFSRVAMPYMAWPRAIAEAARVSRPSGSLWLSLHPLSYALAALGAACRRAAWKAVLFNAYVLVNGLLLALTGRTCRWPYPARVES